MEHNFQLLVNKIFIQDRKTMVNNFAQYFTNVADDLSKNKHKQQISRLLKKKLHEIKFVMDSFTCNAPD